MIEINIPIYAALLSALLLFVQNLLMLNVGMYRTSLKKGVGVDAKKTQISGVCVES